MLVCVSIGNTRTALGLFDAGGSLVGTWSLASKPVRTPDEYAVLVRSLLASRAGAPAPASDAMAVASVVPPLLGLWRETAALLGVASPYVYGEAGGDLGIEVRVDMAARAVGADRLLNAVAARRRYGAPVLVVDVGTATTLDVVGADGAFVGGAIAAGPATAAAGLTAAMPELGAVAFARAAAAADPSAARFGRSTAAALRLGAVWGAGGQIEGLVRAARRELSAPNAPVVVTGGLGAALAAQRPDVVDHVEPALTLLGLADLAAAHSGDRA